MRNNHARVPDFNSFHSSSGNKFHSLFTSRVNPDGTISLVESGREDIKKKINSFASQTDIAFIISKLQMGDTSVLTNKPAMFGDFTQIPKTHAGVLDLVHRAEDAFLSLPLDVRSKFDNDVNKWFASAGSDTWLGIMGLSVEKPVEKPVDNGSGFEVS